MFRRLAEIVFYLGLFAGALAFCWQNLLEYFEGTTGYTSTQEPLTLSDLPTLTFCWRLWESSGISQFFSEKGIRYDKDFIIDMKVKSSDFQSTITLKEDIFVPTQFDFDVHLSELHLRHKNSELKCVVDMGEPAPMTDKQCYKIRTKMTNKIEVDFESFETQLVFRFRSLSPFLMYVMVTSEDNAYGLAGGGWFDGLVDKCYSMYNGDMLEITEVKEYIHLNCSMSYYECLADRFAKFDISQVMSVNGSTCLFKNTCLPFSLPSFDKSIPICKDTITRNCYMKVMEGLEADQANHCMKACKVEEFKIKYIPNGLGFDPSLDWVNKSLNAGNKWDASNSILMGYRFALPKYNRDTRSRAPYKTVEQEYLINTLISLIGTVGGTMGMFVGFSFIGTSDWLYGNVKSIVAKSRTRARESVRVPPIFTTKPNIYDKGPEKTAEGHRAQGSGPPSTALTPESD